MAHELGHTLGLVHEHIRPDRDQHIRVHPDVIGWIFLHNYKIDKEAVSSPGVRYDLNSIMHYRDEVSGRIMATSLVEP